MPGFTDMRKSMFALSLQVQEISDLDPFSGNYFVFVNKNRNILKIIFWHNDGMCMLQKNIGKRKFFAGMSYDYYIRLNSNLMISVINGYNC